MAGMPGKRIYLRKCPAFAVPRLDVVQQFGIGTVRKLVVAGCLVISEKLFHRWWCQVRRTVCDPRSSSELKGKRVTAHSRFFKFHTRP